MEHKKRKSENEKHKAEKEKKEKKLKSITVRNIVSCNSTENIIVLSY
ncbi:hypothetical protein KA005_54215 [bacterium]|nr:hypothetical protein [bacterium]